MDTNEQNLAKPAGEPNPTKPKRVYRLPKSRRGIRGLAVASRQRPATHSNASRAAAERCLRFDSRDENERVCGQATLSDVHKVANALIDAQRKREKKASTDVVVILTREMLLKLLEDPYEIRSGNTNVLIRSDSTMLYAMNRLIEGARKSGVDEIRRNR
jgi:hypothetical protein